jgi:hypothetical protein
MSALSDYQIGKILSDGNRSQVRTARRRSDGHEVVLKSYAADSAGLERSLALREFEYLRKLAGPGIASVLDLIGDTNPPVLVLDRAPGLTMAQWLTPATPLAPGQFLEVAIQLARALSRIHAARLIHCAVSPGNVLVDPLTLRTCLVGLGRARPLGALDDRRRDAHIADGSLHYISPEQTGRMDRVIDSRSDLYSLGATLYFALTGLPPFPGDDALALVHAHIARQPVPPQELRPALPATLSQIVLRLLQKSPEERYQLASALERDLLHCQEQLERTGRIPDDLPIGGADGPHRPIFSRRLHGRESQIAALLACYEQAAQGTVTVVRIEGGTGMGKSSLVHELRSTLIRMQGALVQGKFDAYRRDQPYLGFADALGGLVQQLLTGSDERLRDWREKLTSGLGSSAAALAELVPDLRHVLPDLQRPSVLGPVEARLRLIVAVRRLMGVMATREHPLVLFLDDLQWADADSLDLLRELLRVPDERALLVVTAVHEDGAGQNRALHSLWEALSQHGVPVRQIALEPLDEESCAALLAEALGRSAEELRPLAVSVQRKTGNAPLLIRQFVDHLYDEGLLQFDPNVGWGWSEHALAVVQIPESAVGMLTAKIARLPPAVAIVLERASCLGSAFDLDAIADLGGSPREQLEATLGTLCDEGLIVPTSQGFCFAHDRIRLAAQGLLAPQERARLHGEIFTRLLEQTPPESLDERIFEIADHLIAAAAGGAEPVDRALAVRLQVQACKRALRSGAGGTALHYFEAAERRFAPELWESDPALCFDLFLQGADAAHQGKRFDQATACLDRLAARTLSTVHTVQVLARQIRTSMATQHRHATMQLTLRLMRRFGVIIPARPSWLRTWWEVLRTDWAFRRSCDQEVLKPCGPQNVDRVVPLILFQAAGQSLSMTSKRAVLVGASLALRRYVAFGYLSSPDLALACVGAYRMAMPFGRQQALRYIEAARAWNRTHPPSFSSPRAEMVAITYGDAWIRPRHELIEPLRRVSAAASEQGDFEFACLTDAQRCLMMAMTGWRIQDVDQERSRAEWASWAYAIGSAHTFGQRVFAVLYGREDLEVLLREIESARAAEKELFVYASLQVVLVLLVLGQDERAFDEAEGIAPSLFRAQIGAHEADFCFLHGLAAARVARTGKRRAGLRRLRQCLRALRRWASPHSDIPHMVRFLEAEQHALRGRTTIALSLHLRSAKEAQELGDRAHAALAPEARGTLLRRLNRIREANASLRQAMALYQDWGATAKVESMRAGLGEAAARSSSRSG